MTDLLPCPFCGGEAVDRREIDGFPMIYCNGDECFGPQTSARNFEDALIQWNTRAPQPLASAQADKVRKYFAEGWSFWGSLDLANQRMLLADLGRLYGAPAQEAVNSGEPVAWQYRIKYDDGAWSSWMACKKTMHDTYRAMGKIGHCPAETRELCAVSSTHSRCAKCGCETKGEAALVNGEVWCHPCADGVAHSSTQSGGK